MTRSTSAVAACCSSALVPIATQRSGADLGATPSERAALPDRTASIAARPFGPPSRRFSLSERLTLRLL